jgi:hypothetical protein
VISGGRGRNLKKLTGNYSSLMHDISASNLTRSHQGPNPRLRGEKSMSMAFLLNVPGGVQTRGLGDDSLIHIIVTVHATVLLMRACVRAYVRGRVRPVTNICFY